MFSGIDGIPVIIISTSVPGPPELGLMEIDGMCNPISAVSNSDWALASNTVENGTNNNTRNPNNGFIDTLNY